MLEDQLSYSLFQPLIFIAIAAGLIAVAGRVVTGRGNEEGGAKLADLSFGVTLLAGVYVVVLLVLAALDEPDLVYEAFVIIAVIALFFAILIFLLFVVFELIGSRFTRTRAPKEVE
jgi:hypothetical protein